jgi:hypothetical protein
MAGPYVHCLVAREALKGLYNDPSLSKYQDITSPEEDSAYFPYVCLGAVSPDFPYPAIRMGINSGRDGNGWTWGDKFHKQNTGNFVDVGIQPLQAVADKTDNVFLKKAAWLMGYYSHIITDLVIHAVVYEVVGGCYETHSQEHLHCEVVQDSLLFYDFYSRPPQELIDVGFLKKMLDKCLQEEAPPSEIQSPTPLPSIVFDKDIADFWNHILNQNYSDFYATLAPDIENWRIEYIAIANDATKVFARTFAPGMAYHRTGAIPEGEKAKYYTTVALPDGTKGDYKNKVFDKTVDEVIKRLRIFLKALDNADSHATLKSDLGSWNIDKGTINDKDPKFALWNGKTEWPFNCPGDPPQ